MPARARGCESLPRSDHTVGVRGGRDGRTFAPEGGAPCIYPGRRASRTVNGFRRSWKFEYECLRPTGFATVGRYSNFKIPHPADHFGR